MKFTGLYIDSFGNYSRRVFRDLDAGINILFGPNEWGKTTILEFIRRTLFGYPSTRGSANQYGAEDGRSLGGRIECGLRNGESILINRVSGPKGGRLDIERGGSILSGQDAMARLIGPISESFYSTMYAFGIDELHGSGAFDSDEAKSLIFGAGFGTGMISPATVKRDLQKKADELFLPSSRKRPMNQTMSEIIEAERRLGEIGDSISHYEKIIATRERMKRTSDEVRAQIAQSEFSLGREQSYIKLYPTFINRIEAIKEVARLGDRPDIPKGVRDRLATLRAQRQAARAVVDSMMTEIRVKEEASKALVIDRTLIENQSRIEELKSYSITFREAKNDIENVRRDRAALQSAIDSTMKRLGDGWTEDGVESFELSIEDQEMIRAFQHRLDELEASLTRVNEAIELAENRDMVEAATTTSTIGVMNPSVGLFMMIIASVGLFIGVWRENWEMAIFACIVVVAALIVRFGHLRRKDIAPDRSYRDSLADRREQRLSELNEARASWRDFRSAIGIDKELEPNSVGDYFRLIELAQEKFRQARDLDRRIESMNRTIKHVEELYDSVRLTVSANLPRFDVPAGTALLDKLLEDVREDIRREQSLAEQSRELIIRKEDALRLEGETIAAISDALRAVPVAGEEELDSCIAASALRENLLTAISECEEKIAFAVGADEATERCLAYLSSATREAIEARIVELSDALVRLKERSETLHRETGRVDAEIAALRTQEELSELRMRQEKSRTRLNRQARQWMAASLAGALLDKAIAYYEANRQPAVIALAQEYFAKMTAGRYERIVLSVEAEAISVRQNSDGCLKSAAKLSRGTREQLYLAMRMAAIEEYEKRAEPLPVIMDDILVNFDDTRRRLAGQALGQFARDRQIIVMTCHESMVDLYASLGGRLLQDTEAA